MLLMGFDGFMVGGGAAGLEERSGTGNSEDGVLLQRKENNGSSLVRELGQEKFCAHLLF